MRNLLIEGTYSGNRGIHLQNSNLNVNQLTTEQLKLGDGLLARVNNPFFGLIQIGSLATATTTAAQLLRPYPHFSGIHTPQRLTMAGVWELPIGPGKRWTGGSNPVARKLLAGWQLDWIGTMQSGYPLSVTSAVNTTRSQGGGQPPNSTGKSAKLEGSVGDRLGRYFDITQFVNPAPFRFGNVSRTLPERTRAGNSELGYPGAQDHADWRARAVSTSRRDVQHLEPSGVCEPGDVIRHGLVRPRQ